MENILMADIVKSSSKPGDKVMEEFRGLVKSANKRFKNQIASPLTITLGDEFQGVVKQLNSAVQIVFFLNEQILENEHGFALRYVINYGRIDTEVNPERAHEMLGEGLTKARALLESAKQNKVMVYVCGLEEKQQRELNLAFALYQAIVEDWPEKDYKAVSSFINLRDYKQVAKELNRDISSAWRKEKTLKMKAYFDAKQLITSLAG